MTVRRVNVDGRFMAKVDYAETGCWLWTGCISTNGYGQVRRLGKTHKAHRFAYELLVGPVPVGMDLDHLCRVRRCVNPDHLEAVTRSENLRRGIGPLLKKQQATARTHCKHGHELTTENTRIRPDGVRDCRTCARLRARKRRAQR